MKRIVISSTENSIDLDNLDSIDSIELDVEVEDEVEEVEKIIRKKERSVEKTTELEDDESDELSQEAKEELCDIISNCQQKHNSKMKKKLNKRTAREYIMDCIEFLKGSSFRSECKRLSKLYKVPKTKVADTFAKKVLAAIGDVLDIVISVTHNILSFLISLLGRILLSANGIVMTVVYKISSFFTLGYSKNPTLA